jgi:hypothetical protein
LFYAPEHRSSHFVLTFAAACVMASVYGFLQGAWPFGIGEAAWSLRALRGWWRLWRKVPKDGGIRRGEQKII